MPSGRRWLITGASGQLGSVVVRQLVADGEDVIALSHRAAATVAGVTTTPLDITDAGTVTEIVQRTSPSFILHLAAMSSVGEAYEHPERAKRVNVDGTRAVALAAAEVDAHLIYTSTDMVFDGTEAPYDESATPRPLSQYGRSKLEGESPVLDYARGLVVRPSLMFGLSAIARPSTFAQQLAALRDGRPLKLFEDEYRTPVWLEDVARVLCLLAWRDIVGLLHLPGPEQLSRLDMGLAMAEARGWSARSIVPTRVSELDLPEPRPADLSLEGSRLEALCPEALPMSTVGQVVANLSVEQIEALPGID